MPFISFGSFLSFGSSLNPSIAWARGKHGEGHFRITLPLDPAWYKEQPCTRFRSLQHRKERNGFQHEFIVLKLEDKSICRVERMGDPDTSFDAIGDQGIAAHDIAQSFPPDKLSDADLDTSDVVAEITFPYSLDLWIVLLICRAMQEGERTCNYTLQVFNCYFFALVIQAALTRLVAGWGSAFRDEIWHSTVSRGLSALSDYYAAAPSAREQPFIFRIHSALRPDTRWPAEDLISELEQGLRQLTEVSQACNAVLWYSDMGLAVDYVLCRRVRDVMVGILKDFAHVSPLDSVKTQPEDMLLELVSQAISRHEQDLQAPKLNRIQQCVQRRIHLIQEFQSFLSRVQWAEEWTLESPSSEPQSHPDPLDSPQPQPNLPQSRPDLPQSRLGTSWLISSPFSRVSQLSVWLIYAKKLVLWALQVALGLFWIDLLGSPQPALCVFIEDELEPSLAILKAPKRSNEDETTPMLQKLRSLVAAPQLMLWKEWPWDHIYKPIRQHVLESLRPIEEEVLKFSFLNSTGHAMTVSKFQQHLLERIQDHATRVESFKLGSAANIRDEMEDRISQVWALIRPDATPAPGDVVAPVLAEAGAPAPGDVAALPRSPQAVSVTPPSPSQLAEPVTTPTAGADPVSDNPYSGRKQTTDPEVIHSTIGPTTPLPRLTQLPSGNVHPVPGHVAPRPVPNGRSAFMEDPHMAHNEITARLPHLRHPLHPLYPPHHHSHVNAPRQSVSYLSPPAAWVSPSSQPSFDPHIRSQGGSTGCAHCLGVPSGGYRSHIWTWSGATGPCSCPECTPWVSRSRVMSDYGYRPQAPPTYPYPHTGSLAHPPYAAGGFQYHPTYPRPQPTPANIDTMCGIPERPVPDVTPEHGPNRHAYCNSLYEQPPIGCSTCGYHAAAPAPMPQNTFARPRPRPESVYTQGSSNGFPDPRYQNNVGWPTVRSNLQPQHPRPARWFTQDESPTRTSETAVDDIQLNRASEYLQMPDPDNYRPRNLGSDLI